MAHPFFDAIQFPLHRAEGIEFHRLLTRIDRSSAEIIFLYNQCADDLPLLIIENRSPSLIWADALNNLTVAGALKKLCEIIETNPGRYGQKVRDAIKSIRDAVPPYEPQVFSDGVVVLDRVGLREQIEQLENEMSPLKVLLVRGEPKSGKSHGQYIFERTAIEKGAKPVLVYDGFVVTVEELITYLFSEVKQGGENEIPNRDTTREAWYRLVCIKLAQLAAVSERPLWIAADDLGTAADGTPLLDPEIRKFLDQLALNMGNPSFRKWFCLMLINYPDGPVPTKWRNDFWKEDRTSENDIQLEHVNDFLRLWYAKRNLQITDEALRAQAQKIMDAAQNPASPKPRLRRIHDALSEMLKELERSPNV